MMIVTLERMRELIITPETVPRVDSRISSLLDTTNEEDPLLLEEDYSRGGIQDEEMPTSTSLAVEEDTFNTTSPGEDRDVSDLLKSSFFNKPAQRSNRGKRQSYAGFRQSPTISTPRPNTTATSTPAPQSTTPSSNLQSTPNSSVLSFNAPLADSSFVEQFNLN